MTKNQEVLTEGDVFREEVTKLKKEVDDTIEELDRVHRQIHRRQRQRQRTRVKPRRIRKGGKNTKDARSTT